MRWLLWCFCLLAESYETINHYHCWRNLWCDWHVTHTQRNVTNQPNYGQIIINCELTILIVSLFSLCRLRIMTQLRSGAVDKMASIFTKRIWQPCICQPNDLKLKKKNWGGASKNLGGHGPPSPPLRIATVQDSPIEIWITIKRWCLFKFQNFKPHCTNVKRLHWRLSGDGSVGTPSFSLAISLVTMVRFYHHAWVHIHNSFINPIHCCTLTKPTRNYYSNASVQTLHWLKMCHLYWNDWLKIQSTSQCRYGMV